LLDKKCRRALGSSFDLFPLGDVEESGTEGEEIWEEGFSRKDGELDSIGLGRE